MGNTISTGKLVGAFQGTDGEAVYVMFERTCESNVYPRRPRWNAQTIGGIQAVMRRIFLSASSCAAGSLVGAGNRGITPESYIASWLKELANPVFLEDTIYELAVGSSWTSTIPEGDLDRITAELKAVGATRILEGLAGESASAAASLHADHVALSAIYDGVNVAAWRIIPEHAMPMSHAPRDASLGYNPAKAKVFKVDVPRFMRVSEETNKALIQGEDGQWRCVDGGYAYSYLMSFICNLCDSELREPGAYRTRIKAYREAVTNASVIPDGTQIVVANMADLVQWAKNDIDRIIAVTPHTQVKDGVQMNVPTDNSLLCWATGLPSAHTTWRLSEKAPFEQLCLLAG
ncbi:hypothetical protein NPS53_09510 [Pseudomonas putida]|uniref:hypothetical protein n=1 Tax=Pseudomonas putida TaxID=303 RepID=UPI002363486C|nr:hypothetical protein [Pseudomonas putida]MDD2139814.1 hypothetical protein [Pseudomonas putida]HDS1721738.1 hypothetical protein [Pseudomonas putida]